MHPVGTSSVMLEESWRPGVVERPIQQDNSVESSTSGSRGTACDGRLQEWAATYHVAVTPFPVRVLTTAVRSPPCTRSLRQYAPADHPLCSS